MHQYRPPSDSDYHFTTMKTQPQIDAEVLNYITSLFKIFGKYPDNSGGCYKFAIHLKKQFSGELYYNGDHCVTKVGTSYFDINGKLKISEGFIHESNFGSQYFKESFKEYL